MNCPLKLITLKMLTCPGTFNEIPTNLIFFSYIIFVFCKSFTARYYFTFKKRRHKQKIWSFEPVCTNKSLTLVLHQTL